jgi:hypothetical protein
VLASRSDHAGYASTAATEARLAPIKADLPATPEALTTYRELRTENGNSGWPGTPKFRTFEE